MLRKINISCFILYLYLYVLNIPQVLIAIISIPKSLQSILAFAPMVLLIGFFQFTYKKIVSKNSPIKLLLLFFLSYIVIGTISSLNNYEYIQYFNQASRYYIRVLLEIFCFYFFIMSLSKKELLSVLKHFTIIYIVMAFSIPISAYLGFNLFGELSELKGATNTTIFSVLRPAGLNGNANPAAYESITGLILVLFWIMNSKSKLVRVFLSVICICIILSTLLTFSNTGMISMLLVFFIILIKFKHFFKGIFKVVLFCIIVALILIPTLDFSFTRDINSKSIDKLENLSKILSLDKNNIDFSERDIRLKKGFDQLKKNFIFGSGLGVFKDYISVHNTYLTIIGESGIFPFLFFLVFLSVYSFKGAIYYNPSVSFLFLAVIGTYALFSLTLHNMIDKTHYLVLLMLIGRGRGNFDINMNEI